MVSDKRQIKKLLLNNYHKGHEISDGELFRPVLHDDWRIFWINQEKKIDSADKETYISWYKPEKIEKRLKWTTKIINIDIEDRLAIAKIIIFNQDFGYIDYFQFMKTERQWIIVNKISERLEMEKIIKKTAHNR